MKKIHSLIILLVLLTSCEKNQDEILADYQNVMSLKTENNNAYADNFSRIKIIAEFPDNFSTEDDGKVEFFISKDTEEHKSESIRLVYDKGISKKIAETEIIHNRNEILQVRAVITINGVEITKTTNIEFKKAFFDDINISSSSLTLSHDNFTTIQLTTELSRNNGKVTLNSLAETVVEDNLGNPIGIFNNYKNKTDASGKILNNFTLGNSNYTGPLYVIASSANEQGITKKDTLIIYAN